MKRINQLKDQLDKNNIPPLTQEQKYQLLFGSDKEISETLKKILKL